ncbi:MAG: hypothetical protein AAFP78_01330, partial [Pseudomonadota bacterium]
WIGREGAPMKNVVFSFGKRWHDAVWRPGPNGGEILVRETPVYAPLAFGLNQLGASSDCDFGEGRFASVSLATGRIAAFDIAPRGWAVAAPLAAERGAIVADLRAVDEEGAETTAEREIAALCAEKPTAETDWRAAVCNETGMELSFEWSDGDWRLLDTAEAGLGRLLVSADLSTSVRETCSGEQVNGRLRAQCVLRVAGDQGERVIEAPGRFFGDLAISRDGRFLASLVTGRGRDVRRFDLFDLSTGEATDLSHLLELDRPWDAAR